MSGTLHPAVDTFPPPNFPTAFADGVLNATVSPSVVKFYLFRQEPSLKGDNQFLMQPTLQIVLPVEGFAAALVYLNRHLEILIERGFITRERVEEFQRTMAKSP